MTIDPKTESPLEIACKQELRATNGEDEANPLDPLFEVLPPRQKQVILARFPQDGTEPLTLREAATKFGVSNNAIHLAEKSALGKMKAAQIARENPTLNRQRAMQGNLPSRPRGPKHTVNFNIVGSTLPSFHEATLNTLSEKLTPARIQVIEASFLMPENSGKLSKETAGTIGMTGSRFTSLRRHALYAMREKALAMLENPAALNGEAAKLEKFVAAFEIA